jgi:large subunit ribosomal protein L18
MFKKESKNALRKARHLRSARHLRGSAEKPRFCVFKSQKHYYVQVIDDVKRATILGIGTASRAFREKNPEARLNKDTAAAVGKMVAEECLKRDIKQVVFDRNGYPYHGRIRAIAEAAREQGLSL